MFYLLSISWHKVLGEKPAHGFGCGLAVLVFGSFFTTGQEKLLQSNTGHSDFPEEMCLIPLSSGSSTRTPSLLWRGGAGLVAGPVLFDSLWESLQLCPIKQWIHSFFTCWCTAGNRNISINTSVTRSKKLFKYLLNSIYQAVISFVIHLYIWLFLFHRNPVISRLSEGSSCAVRCMKNSIAWPLPCFVYVNTSYIQAVWYKLFQAYRDHWNSD